MTDSLAQLLKYLQAPVPSTEIPPSLSYTPLSSPSPSPVSASCSGSASPSSQLLSGWAGAAGFGPPQNRSLPLELLICFSHDPSQLWETEKTNTFYLGKVRGWQL